LKNAGRQGNICIPLQMLLFCSGEYVLSELPEEKSTAGEKEKVAGKGKI
jgi:hypothetical protein